MDKRLDFFQVDAAYIAYLLKYDSRVPKVDYSAVNAHEKFLCGIVLKVHGHDYFAPISSFRTSQRTNIIIKDINGKDVASIRFSFMIPVPPGAITVKRIADEPSAKYRNLLNMELQYCRRNANAIYSRAKFVYEAVTIKKDPLMLKNCCDFSTLETACAAYTNIILKKEISDNASPDKPAQQKSSIIDQLSIGKIKPMICDNGEKTQDMLVLDDMSLNVFDYESLRHYRNRMKVNRPGHVWEMLEDIEFLQKLGAIGIGEDEMMHPTAAGLLMFGFEYEITREYPNYFLDYQENYDVDVRFTDRIYSTSGEWSGNIFDFFFKAYNKLIQNPKIKVPFKMKDGLTRLDDTPIHEALREALANCVSNADFYGERGLVIRNNIDEIIFENPGIFRIELREALSGGVSSPRNAVILKMLNLLNIGERTGSGIPLIFKAWKGEGFNEPVYTEQIEINRCFLSLSLEKTSDKSK